MPTLDLGIKEELVNCVNSFFISYKANLDQISKVIDILAGAAQELESYKQQLEKTKGTAKIFPETLPPEESRKLWREGMAPYEVRASEVLEKELAKKSEFGRKLDELHSFLDGALMVALTSYELQVIKPMKEFIVVFLLILDRIAKQIKTKYFVIKFNTSEIDALKSVLSYISEQIAEFDTDSEEVFSGIINLKKHRPVGSGRSFKPTTPKILLEDFNNFLKANKPRIIRLNDTIKLLTDELKILDKETQRLVRAL